MSDREVKVKVVLEDGYQKRFTACCIDVLRKKREAKAQEACCPGYKAAAQEKESAMA